MGFGIAIEPDPTAIIGLSLATIRQSKAENHLPGFGAMTRS
jgi:hypothetical protein